MPEAADRVVGIDVPNRDDEYFEGILALALDDEVLERADDGAFGTHDVETGL